MYSLEWEIRRGCTRLTRHPYKSLEVCHVDDFFAVARWIPNVLEYFSFTKGIGREGARERWTPLVMFAHTNVYLWSISYQRRLNKKLEKKHTEWRKIDDPRVVFKLPFSSLFIAPHPRFFVQSHFIIIFYRGVYLVKRICNSIPNSRISIVHFISSTSLSS